MERSTVPCSRSYVRTPPRGPTPSPPARLAEAAGNLSGGTLARGAPREEAQRAPHGKADRRQDPECADREEHRQDLTRDVVPDAYSARNQPVSRGMEVTVDPSEPLHQDGGDDEAVHRQRQQHDRRKELTVAPEARRRGPRAVDDREHQGRDREADQMGGALVGDPRDSDDEARQAHQQDEEDPDTREPRIFAELLAEESHPHLRAGRYD